MESLRWWESNSCPFCVYTGNSLDEIRLHMKEYHPVVIWKTSDYMQKYLEENNMTPKFNVAIQKLKCGLCKCNIDNMYELMEHWDNRHLCNVCDKIECVCFRDRSPIRRRSGIMSNSSSGSIWPYPLYQPKAGERWYPQNNPLEGSSTMYNNEASYISECSSDEDEDPSYQQTGGRKLTYAKDLHDMRKRCCRRCNLQFDSMSKYMEHQRELHRDKLVKLYNTLSHIFLGRYLNLN